MTPLRPRLVADMTRALRIAGAALEGAGCPLWEALSP
jgi:hypothetical protein